MERILIAEDDEKIAQLERDYLEISGYETEIVRDGAQVVTVLRKKEFALVLLDVMLPHVNGYDICRQIRDEIDIPILMVTARGEGADEIRGLGLGADDYITKPFDPLRLAARVRAHIKRYKRIKSGGAREADKSSEEIRIQDLVIETKTWKVRKAGKEIKLPNREFELLRFLAENPNHVFSREQLFEAVWGYDFVSDAATVSVHINRLREKIEEDARNPRILETVWGAGYRLNT